jgi:predicted transcriptional regulator
MSETPRPTDGELEILRVLWRDGPATVRDVHAAISKAKPHTGYTTVLKLMQIMAEKGLVARDETSRAHVYRAQVSEDQAERQIVRNLLDRVFDGSASRMMMQALSSRKASAEELAEIRHLLDTFEQKGGA